MLQIKNTLGGGKPEGLYVWKKNAIGSELKEINKSISTLPYNFYQGCAVIYNGEIHILGGADSTTKHYKWNGSSWASVSTLPYNFVDGCAVVLNNEIHIFGSSYSSSYYKYHYKWNGSSWTSVSTLPYNFRNGCAVVLDNEIHILGSYESSANTNHYKWDGTSWTKVSTLPYYFNKSSAVVFNGQIHILGSGYDSTYYKYHYKFDGTSWTSVSTLPYRFYGGAAVVYNNEIHILGSYESSANTNHYKYDGTSWTSVGTLPYGFYYGSAVVFNNAIHTLGSGYSPKYYKYHYLIYGYVPVYTFLDYIVSDKETAYPDGGEKGGYWYEKVIDSVDISKFGCTKFEEGSFTPTSDATNITVSHSLNIYPQFVICYSDSITSSDSDYVKKSTMLISTIIVKTYSMYGNGTAKTYEETNENGETNIIFRSGDSYKYFKSGVTYNYVVLG